MLFQQITPDTLNYMIGGFVVFFIVMIAYLASYFMRFKNLKQDLEVLQEIENED